MVAGDRGIQPQNLADCQVLAVVVARAGLFRFKTPDEALVAMLYGLENGFSAIQALEGVYVVKKKPTLGGDLMLAKLRQSPLMLKWKQPWYTGTEPNDDWTCHVASLRKGETDWYETTFSVADAKRAKLWARRSSDGEAMPWITYPQRQMYYRALAFHARDFYPDVVKGKIYEEVRDYPETLVSEAGEPAPPAGELPPPDPLLEQALGGSTTIVPEKVPVQEDSLGSPPVIEQDFLPRKACSVCGVIVGPGVRHKPSCDLNSRNHPEPEELPKGKRGRTPLIEALMARGFDANRAEAFCEEWLRKIRPGGSGPEWRPDADVVKSVVRGASTGIYDNWKAPSDGPLTDKDIGEAFAPKLPWET